MLKRLLRSAFIQEPIAAFVAFYIRFVWLTSRVERVSDPESEILFRRGQAFIAAFWHSRILLMPYHWPQGRERGNWVHVLISRHRDGAMIARAVRSFKITAIPGSSRRGGREALQAMIRLLQAGKIVALTPDGPKGPRQRAKFGIACAARAAGVPVIPVTYSVKRRRIFNSWDRFLLAWPFNRILLHAAAPVKTAGMSLEAAREAIEAAMNRQLDAAEAYFGHPPLPPAPPFETEGRADTASDGG